MTPEERDLIAGLFDRLRQADQAAPKDRDAEDLIRRLVAEQPSAPYLLTQTVLVQEHALQNAQARIAELERQTAEQRAAVPAPGGSFLGGLLGGGPWARRPDAGAPPQARGWSQPGGSQAGSVPQAGYAPPPQPGYPTTANMPASAGGGFLRGALTTAAGVAGGALLFQGISGLLGHNSGAFGSAVGTPSATENVTNNYYGDSGQQQADYAPPQDYGSGGGGVQSADYQPDDVVSGDDGGSDWA